MLLCARVLCIYVACVSAFESACFAGGVVDVVVRMSPSVNFMDVFTGLGGHAQPQPQNQAHAHEK